MKRTTALFLPLAIASVAFAADLLAPGDAIIAIDSDAPSFISQYPMGEAPPLAFDNDPNTKYLNFGEEGTGVIINAGVFPGEILQSIQFTTANDSPERDPASYELYGTDDILCSVDDLTGNLGGSEGGLCENWTLISSGDLALPEARNTPGDVVSFTNATPYDSYKIRFPTVKDPFTANSMQIAEIGLFTSTDGSGTSIVDNLDDARAFGPLLPDSRYPGDENPTLAIDGVIVDGDGNSSKYLNFGKENSGFIVTPSATSIIDGFEVWPANDFEGRDPADYELYGTNDAVCSEDNSFGDCENWTLITSGTLTLPADRNDDPGENFSTGVVPIANGTEYESYKFVVKSLKDTADPGSDSTQYAEVQFYGTVTGDPGPVCDINGDEVCDIVDLDSLYDSIAAGDIGGPADIDGSGLVDNDDIDAWLLDAGTENGKVYKSGDVDLDGDVDGPDFTTFAFSFGNSGLPDAYWGSGNFDGDLNGFDTGGADFTALALNFGHTSVGAVPEPAGLVGLLGGIVLLLAAGRKR